MLDRLYNLGSWCVTWNLGRELAALLCFVVGTSGVSSQRYFVRASSGGKVREQSQGWSLCGAVLGAVVTPEHDPD